MKSVLIISPYFPPSNTADMQRVRTSLLYYQQFGWEAEVVCVNEKYANNVQDELLLQSLPPGLLIYKINALPVKWTSKIGFGSLGFRCFLSYLRKVNSLLRKNKYDLIFFSTTQFPVCALGAYWKNKFGIPYVIDMQDPWYSDYYRSKPKSERPPKFQTVYGMHKKLEAIAMGKVDGLISVSDAYINELRERHATLKDVPSATITFGAFEPDNKIANDNTGNFKSLLQSGFINVVYVGRGGADMQTAVLPVFEALKKGITDQPELFSKLKFYFIGTSYAPAGTGTPTIKPIAAQFGVENRVVEITDRISYYHTLLTLRQADALFIPGSSDPRYTASKIYSYLLAKKPVMAVFNKNSSTVKILNECTENAVVLTIDEEGSGLNSSIYETLKNWASGAFIPVTLTAKFEEYSAKNLTGKQTELFNSALKYFETKNTNA